MNMRLARFLEAALHNKKISETQLLQERAGLQQSRPELAGQATGNTPEGPAPFMSPYRLAVCTHCSQF